MIAYFLSDWFDRFTVLFCWNEVTVLEKVLSSFSTTEFIIFEGINDACGWDIFLESKTFEWWLSASFGLIYINNQTMYLCILKIHFFFRWDVYDSIERKFRWNIETYFWLVMNILSSMNWFHSNSIEAIRWWCSLYHVWW